MPEEPKTSGGGFKSRPVQPAEVERNAAFEKDLVTPEAATPAPAPQPASGKAGHNEPANPVTK